MIIGATTSRHSLRRRGTLAAILFVFVLASSAGLAVTVTTAGSGNWNSATVNAPWPGGTVPAALDDIVIADGHTVTVSAAVANFPGSVTVEAGGQLTVGGFNFTNSGPTVVSGVVLHNSTTGAKTFSGNVTINNGGLWTETVAEAISFGGNLQNDGTLTAGAGIHTFSGAGKTFGGANPIVIPLFALSGTYTNNGTLTVVAVQSGSGTLTQGAGSILNLGGSSFTPTLVASASGNTVSYTNAAQSVRAVTYHNLTLSGSGIKTTTSITVNGVLSMEGTATASAAPTYGPAATLQYDTAAVRTNGLEWITPFAASGGVVITNTGTITLNAAKVFNATAPLAVRSGASLASGNFKLTLGGTFSNAGTFTAGTNTVEWNAAGAQSIATGAYYNVIFSGSGAKSVVTGTTVAGNLSIAPTGSATASVEDGFNLGVASLTLGSLGRINGTWGSASAPGVTYTNGVFFAPTTGYLTVTADTRQTPTVTNWPTASSITTNQTLGASILTGGAATNAAGAAVAGSFAFDTPSYSPPAGTYSAAVTFTPTDLTSYKTVGGSVNVAVATISYYHVAAGGSATSPYDTWGKAATDIQTAVNKASADLVPGTTECVVLVTNDTYTLTSQILITNGITLRGFGGRDATFINGNYPASSNRCIEIRNTPTMATVDGFTITNGYAYLQPAGGGVFATNSFASIVNCTISRNRSATTVAGNGHGGGIGAIRCNGIVITNCLVSSNTNTAPTIGYGAGIYISWTKGLLSDSQILDNSVVGGGANGGGVFVSQSGSAIGASEFVVSNCTVAGNYADSAGGIYMFGATATRCLVSNNSVRVSSGGVMLYGSGATRLFYSTIVGNRAQNGGGIAINRGSVYNCRIIGNYATVAGGGYVSSEGSLVNSLIAGNRSDGTGGGVEWINKGNGYNMINCTVVRNSAGGVGGGINSAATDSNIFINVIVTDNKAAGSWDNLSGIVNRTNFIYSCSPLLGAGAFGNITADPQFVDAGSGFGTNAVLGDYRLRIGSPAIDAARAAGAPATDLDDNSRPADGDGNGLAAYDMGAYETGSDGTGGVFRCSFSAPTNRALDSLDAVFTAYAAGPNTNGLAYYWTFGDGATSDWSSATRVIPHSYGLGSFAVTLTVSNELGQTASYARTPFITVYPSYAYVSTNGGSVSPYGSWATAASNLQDAVDVAGEGYTIAVLVSNGTYTLASEIAIPKTITVKSVNGKAVTAINGNGVTRCVNMTGTGAVLEGFTVSNGYMSVGTPLYGAGVYTAGGTVKDCTITLNRMAMIGTAQEQGVGVYARANAVVTNCEISFNSGTGSSSSKGGGVFVTGALVTRCLITRNSLRIAGGISAEGYSICRDSEISYNTALSSGSSGGAYTLDGTLENCLVLGNESGSTVGGVYCTRDTDIVRNCTIVGNKAATTVGGMNVADNFSAVNTIVWGNLAGGTNSNFGGITNKVTFTCAPELVNGVAGNITSAPQFVSWSTNNGYGTNHVRGDYTLKAGSPCLDSGTAAGAPDHDLAGGPRPLDGNRDNVAAFDMGAYETMPRSTGSLIFIK